MHAKKSLGQNFLKSFKAAESLVTAAQVTRADTIVEVGPGKGIITRRLLERARCVIAIEKDERMTAYVHETFAQEIASGKLCLRNEDILNFNPRDWKLKAGHWKLVGSIPYYITGILLRTFLSADEQPRVISLIVQKEVARRIVASNNKESILSISVKAFGEPKYIKTISRKLFSPEPNVDSAIIVIENISREFFTNIPEKFFFALVKAGFASKRKKVLSNIKKQFPDVAWETIFANARISSYARAEDLSRDEWGVLCKAARA